MHRQLGGIGGRLYLDLGDETWRAVEIDATGWRVMDNPPVRFRRTAGMRALPMPVRGGSIKTLRSFLNVQSHSDFVLTVAWILACLRDRGPYPVLVLSGEQGSAKSNFSLFLRALLDPNTAPLRAMPREERDLFIAANNRHLLAFDNVSRIPTWISDGLCLAGDRGRLRRASAYTDQDEVLFEASRPVILNSIEDIVTRPDLADRGVFLRLEPITEERRRLEQELWAAFEKECPGILGVLLDAVVEGCRRLPKTHLPKLPRMADFALWATACETALTAPSGDLPAQDRHRDQLRPQGSRTDPHDPDRQHAKPSHQQKRRRAIVRTVRSVRGHSGPPRHGQRVRRRRRSGGWCQPRAQCRDQCGRCGRKSAPPNRFGKILV